MRHFEKRLCAIEGQRQPCQVGVVTISDTKIRAGETAAMQLAEQEKALGYSVPPATREGLLNGPLEPGCMRVSFFTRED